MAPQKLQALATTKHKYCKILFLSEPEKKYKGAETLWVQIFTGTFPVNSFPFSAINFPEVQRSRLQIPLLFYPKGGSNNPELNPVSPGARTA